MPFKEGKYWRGVVKIRGKRIQKTFPLRRSAAEWERSMRAEIEKEQIEQEQPKGLDLLTFCSRYLLQCESLGILALPEKKAVCRRLLKEIGPESAVDDITAADIGGYLEKQRVERSAGAANKDRKNLSAMWARGVKALLVKSNPVSGIDKYPIDRKVQHTPTREDVEKVFFEADRVGQIMLLAYIQTGARRSELFRWKWGDDVDFQRKKYRLGTRKTRDGSLKHEWFPMSGELFDDLLWLHANRKFSESPYVFVNDLPPNEGTPFKQRRKFLRGLCQRAGVEPFSFHGLRRFCACCLADSGKSTNSIRRFLRHANVRTTEIYIQNINDDLVELSAALSTEKLFSVPDDGTRTRNK